MKTIVISLGGSIINPGKINDAFLKKFRNLVVSLAKKNRVVIVCGGGSVSRQYVKSLKKFTTDDEVLDWMGIFGTYSNAFLVMSIFGDKAFDKVVMVPDKRIRTKKRVIVAGGWKPGWSTDYDAMMLAAAYKAEYVLNLSDVKYLYDKDPAKYKEAKKIKETTYKDFLGIVGEEWSPSKHVPFDPIAAKLGERKKIPVVLMDGRNLQNVKDFIAGRRFKGTLIK